MIESSLLLPAQLVEGATIAVISPSWGGARLPQRFERGIEALRSLGFEVRIMPSARGIGYRGRDWLSASGLDRANDFHAALLDESVGAILTSIGGDHTLQMLEHVDMDLVADHPKIICGYSDTTVLLQAIHSSTRLVTFYGPAVVPEFGDLRGPDVEVVEHWAKVVSQCRPAGRLPESPWQSSESRAVADGEGRSSKRIVGERRTILKAGDSAGPILVGCLPSMLRLAGTRWWPSTLGRIVVLEFPDGRYSVKDADADLAQLWSIGAMANLAGLAIGRTPNWDSNDRVLLHELLLELVVDQSYPILSGIEVSHTSPLWTLPIGVQGSILGKNFSIDERAVSPIAR